MKVTAAMAKKSLGQNFLHDKNIADKIVRCLNISSDDYVLEIGPGPGALTGILAAAQPKLLALVEKDYRWARDRQKNTVQGAPQLVILGDALCMPWNAFDERWKIIGNLPYNIASPLMWDIFSQARRLSRAVFMIQKEVGERVCARPGSKAYGALSVWIQAFVSPKLEVIVPPDVFIPRPKVDSAVLSFTAKNEETQPDSELARKLSWVLHRCFQQRRKQLGSTLKDMNSRVNLFERAQIIPTLRPEALTVEEFLQLARALPDTVSA